MAITMPSPLQKKGDSFDFMCVLSIIGQVPPVSHVWGPGCGFVFHTLYFASCLTPEGHDASCPTGCRPRHPVSPAVRRRGTPPRLPPRRSFSVGADLRVCPPAWSADARSCV